MQCDEFEVQLHEVLDRREAPSADPLLAGHAKGCSGCQRMLTLYEALFDGLALAEVPQPAADFSRQITHAAQVGRRRRWRAPIAGGLLALAASLLVMVAVGGHYGASQSDPVSRPFADGSAAENAANNHDAAVADSTGSAQPKADSGPASMVAITPGGGLGSSESSADGTVPSEQQPTEFDDFLDEWRIAAASQGLSIADTSAATNKLPGFRPLAVSLTTAFSALRQTLPGGKSEEPPPAKPQAGYHRAVEAQQA